MATLVVAKIERKVNASLVDFYMHDLVFRAFLIVLAGSRLYAKYSFSKEPD